MVGVNRGFWLGSALIASTCCYAAGAQAQIFKCVDPDGHVVFSDTDCGSQAEKVEVVQSSGGLSPIGDSGLSAQEKAELGAIEARDALAAEQRAAAGAGSSGGSNSAPAPSPPPSTAPKSSY